MSHFTLSSSGPTSLYLAEQVSQLDQLVMQHEGIAATVLMKRAGRAALELLLEQWPQTQSLHIFCGAGNNAGDGYVLAALARQRKLEVSLWWLCPPEKLTGAAAQAYQYALREDVNCQSFDADKFTDSQLMQTPHTVLVDALLGTGSQGELREVFAQTVTAINQAAQTHTWPVLALDIPTGVNPDTGAVASVAVKATTTISFIGQKQGLFTGAGRAYSGQRYFSDLEVDDQWLHLVNPTTEIIDHQQSLAKLPERNLDDHKGHCGHLLVIGGDAGVAYGYGGAPIMAAQMALRSGAGLVSLATRRDFVAPALARQPEMMVAAVDNGQALLPLLSRATGVVIGPGLGRSAWSEQLLYQVLSSETAQQPLVLDADALYLLSQTRFSNLPTVAKQERRWILTPHPGEAASLLGVSVEQIQADRFAAAQSIQQQYGGTVILKGAGTLVVTSSSRQYLCDAGNPGMASGGMGDVLSGVLGALLVQGMDHNSAAILGTLLHSKAADLAVKEHGVRGLLATDLMAHIKGLLDA